MSWAITIAGTVHIDDVTTPGGHHPCAQGGTAVYSALAASDLAPVRVASIVGRDREATVRELFADRAINTDDLQVSDLPTFHWKAVHDFSSWTTSHESVLEAGCDARWDRRLGAESAAAPVLFIGSMAPAFQLDLLAQSSAFLIGAGTMTEFIDSQPATVRSVVERIDILFVNRTELAGLEPAFVADWHAAARALIEPGRGRLRAVVVTAGPLGAAVVSEGRLVELPAAPVETVVDPTGAGDALAAGFLGACARAERAEEDFFPQALRSGLHHAALAISRFGCDGLARSADPRR